MSIRFLTTKKDWGMGLIGSENRGFTLIELIITISILAILVTILVVAINPAEQLARSRDSKRVADLDALKSSINLYLATATGTINLDGNSSGNENQKCVNGTGNLTLWTNTDGAVSTSTFPTIVSGTRTDVFVTSSATSTQTVGTAGWMPAKLTDTPGGSPIGTLPLDPSGQGAGTTYYYSYACEKNNKQFELGAMLESTYFLTDLDLDGKDGGASSTRYETGSNMTLL